MSSGSGDGRWEGKEQTMREWLTGFMAADVLLLITLAGVVAILGPRERSERAFKVLRMILVVLTGAGVTAIVTLREAGVI